MSILFKSILSLSFSGTLLIILLFLLKPLFRDRISKRWQYYMWMIVIVRLLVPFTLPASPVNTFFQEVDRTMVQITTVSEEDIAHVLQGEKDTAANSHSFQSKGEISAAVSTAASKDLAAALINNLWFVWLMGALLMLVRKITIYQGFVRRVKAECSEVSDIDLLDRLAQYGEKAGVRTPVELYLNSHISSPLLIGFFRPCIVLRTVDLSESDIQYTLLHELTHFKHRDMFYKWLVQLTLCLHWFNPFVYLMCHEINQACELACDETIISKLEKKEQETYGDMLMNAIGAGGACHNSIASMTLYENKKMIKERLRAIINFKKKSVWITLASLVLVINLFAVSMTIGAYAGPFTVEGEPAESTAFSIAGDKRGETDTSTITDCMDSDLAYINIIRYGGVYYILCRGVLESGDHTAGVTVGTVKFLIIREDGYVYIGPFEVTERLVDNVTEQCNDMLEKDSKAISQGEASLLIMTAAKIQSGDDSGFIDRNDWGTSGDEIWSALVEEYKKWGIEKTDSTYYYQNESVSLLYDLGTDGSARINYDPSGDVNLRLRRDDNGIISKVDYLSEMESLKILNEFHIVTDASLGTETNAPDSRTDSIETATTPRGTATNAPDRGTDSIEASTTLRAGIYAADFWDEVDAIYMTTGNGIVIADLIMSGN